MSQAFAARLSISYVGGSSPNWNIVGKVYDDGLTSWTAVDVTTGDIIVDESAFFGTTNRWRITTINSASGRDLDCVAVWDDTGTEDANGPQPGEAAIARVSTNHTIAEIPTQAFAKISENVQTRLQNIDTRKNIDVIGGEVNDGTNLGSGAGIYTSNSGVHLQFKSLTYSAPISLTPSGTEVQITSSAEANTASNLGTQGASIRGLATTKAGVDLQFKSIEAGTNVTLTDSTNTVKIDVSGGTGDVVGPSSATDEAIVRFDTTTGKLLQDYSSNAPTISDAGIATYRNNVLVTNSGQLDVASGAFNVDGSGNLTAAGMALGSDASYDVYYRDGSGDLARLGYGTEGQVLTTHSSSSAPSWEDAASGISEYTADSSSGEEILVKATGTGVTASRTGNVVTFSIPTGVLLLSARIRISGSNLVTGAMVIDLGEGYSGMADRWVPNCHCFREDTGSTLATTVTLSTSDYDQVTINNLNATTTNMIIMNL